MLDNILKALPIRCHLCRHQIEDHTFNANLAPWCQTCFARFPVHHHCLKCGFSLPLPQSECGHCLFEPPIWDTLICLSDYQFPFDHFLQQIKYHRHYALTQPLAQLLSEKIPQPAPYLIPVPMHWRRRIVRGANHSQLLASALAKALDVTVLSHVVTRRRATKKQQGLTRKARLTNLNGAFQIQAPLPEHLAIVDDVVTTGATINELCHLLRKHGVKQIEIYCLCRTSIENHQ